MKYEFNAEGLSDLTVKEEDIASVWRENRSITIILKSGRILVVLTYEETAEDRENEIFVATSLMIYNAVSKREELGPVPVERISFPA